MHRLLLATALAAAPATAFAQGARDNIDALIEQQAKANGVPASFVHAVVKRESNYNPNARGGSALGLMQIKHATAKGLGYQGDAAGLYDPEVNLRYGVAYLAGAYKTAKGNLAQAYTYYNRGYYYAAKRQGVATEVASVMAPVAASASAVASLFTGAPPAADPNLAAAGTALAYAPALAAPAIRIESVEVPLPPRRPAALGGASAETVQLAAADLGALQVAPQPSAAPPPAHQISAARAPAGQPQTAAADAAHMDSVEVPLPPRRPSPQMLAAAAAPTPRPAALARKAGAQPIQEASALPLPQPATP